MKYTVFRHAAYDTPWWAVASSAHGRFHEPGKDIVQYLSLHPLGPAAEMLRHHVGPGGDPDHLLLNLWTATVELDAVTRVDFADCPAHKITPDELVGDDYRPTQALAAALRKAGVTAMIAPSAALPGTHTLMLFGVRLLHPYLGTPRTVDEIPTGHLTDGARSPAEVAPHVRWRGTPHKAAEQWKTSGKYDLFDDPIATR